MEKRMQMRKALQRTLQSLSHVQLFATPWTAACQASLSFTISQSLLKFTSIELVVLSNHLILCHLLLLLPSIFPIIRVVYEDRSTWISFSLFNLHSNLWGRYIYWPYFIDKQDFPKVARVKLWSGTVNPSIWLQPFLLTATVYNPHVFIQIIH